MKETTPLFVHLYVTNLHFILQLSCCLCCFPQCKQLFSYNEMDRRLNRIRSHMEQEGIDACVFTSYYNVYYFSDFLYCSMGRQYCLIVTDETTNKHKERVYNETNLLRVTGKRKTTTAITVQNLFSLVIVDPL